MFVFCTIHLHVFIQSSHIIVVVVGGENGRVRYLHRTFGVISDLSLVVYTDSGMKMMIEGFFHQKKIKTLAFIALLTFINPVSMVTLL